MHPNNPILIIPPHQRTAQHLLRLGLRLLQPLLRILRDGGLTSDGPLPGREVPMTVQGPSFDAENVEVGEGFVEGRFDSGVHHVLAFAAFLCG